MNNKFDGLYDSISLKETIADMFKFQTEFTSKIDVENALDRALEYSQWLVALQYEVGKQKNTVISNEKRRVRSEKQKYVTSLYYGKLKEHYQAVPATSRERFRKLHHEELDINLEELENEYDITLSFINEQLWNIKPYIKNLESRIQYFAFLESVENKN